MAHILNRCYLFKSLLCIVIMQVKLVFRIVVYPSWLYCKKKKNVQCCIKSMIHEKKFSLRTKQWLWWVFLRLNLAGMCGIWFIVCMKLEKNSSGLSRNVSFSTTNHTCNFIYLIFVGCSYAFGYIVIHSMWCLCVCFSNTIGPLSLYHWNTRLCSWKLVCHQKILTLRHTSCFVTCDLSF